MNIGEWLPRLWQASLTTVYMVGVSTLFTVVFGLPLGVLLMITGENGLKSQPILNKTVGFVVNLARSLPFIILLVVLIPFTRALVGTSIGPTATIVPLTLAAVPFFARVVESSLREVPRGLIDRVDEAEPASDELQGRTEVVRVHVGDDGRLVHRPAIDGLVVEQDLARQAVVDIRAGDVTVPNHLI